MKDFSVYVLKNRASYSVSDFFAKKAKNDNRHTIGFLARQDFRLSNLNILSKFLLI